jgi:hypothetical protein
MEAVTTSETSVSLYETTPRNIQNTVILTRRRENLKFYNSDAFLLLQRRDFKFMNANFCTVRVQYEGGLKIFHCNM